MGRQRARNPARRTYIPDEYLRMLGARIRLALQNEHIRHDVQRGKRRQFTIERACVTTGIAFSTMNAYMAGQRSPNILDMRAIIEFTGETFESLMSVIPSRKELDDLYDMNRQRAREEADRRHESGEGPDEEDDDGEFGTAGDSSGQLA